MIKWEYTELRLPAPDPLEAYHTDHTKMLRDLGQCGWELVSAFPDPAQPGDTVMWFKRPVEDEPPEQPEESPLDLDTLNILYGLLSPKTLAQMRIDMGTWEGEYAWLLRANLCSHIGGLDRTETEYQAYRDALRELDQ